MALQSTNVLVIYPSPYFFQNLQAAQLASANGINIWDPLNGLFA